VSANSDERASAASKRTALRAPCRRAISVVVVRN
jgi:hypothetical protein